ncbi:MAG: hypothetical protein Faunusvirus2_46 [Faunusvirus sp.]|jgi:hypothetical protein|uniref:Uncharacterized protein n=1 Tax=Faunusvirus sp. TaxID=2487766 RepID=A0A3G5A0K7_9VIRU|nr:MAG: hypothetical protein Faunusvirus2_46 [Faunusvirus sp.]
MNNFVKNINECIAEIGFKHKPILVGGLAMQYYGIRKGHDYDFIASKSDHNRLEKTLGQADDIGKIYVDLKGKFGEVDIFIRIYKYDYQMLKKNAIEEKYFYIVSLEDLLAIKTISLVDKDVPSKFRKKATRDNSLIAKTLFKESSHWKDDYKDREGDF